MRAVSPHYAIPCLILAAAFFLAVPAAATLVLSGSTLMPGTLPLFPLSAGRSTRSSPSSPPGEGPLRSGIRSRWRPTSRCEMEHERHRERVYRGPGGLTGRVAFINGFVLSYLNGQ